MRRQYALFIIVLIAAASTPTIALCEHWRLTHYRQNEITKDIYPYTFVFFGDCRPPFKGELKEDMKFTDEGIPHVFVTMIAQINKEDPAFVIGGGDYVLMGTEENFQKFLTVARDLNPPLFYACGNHDNSKHYEPYLGERIYSFTYKNSLFVILDNSNSMLDKRQLKFLEKQLNRDAEYKFVFLHMPPYDPGGDYHMIAPEEFEAIIMENDVDYVFCSHIHAFYEGSIGDAVLIISGGAGAPLKREGFYHYIVVHVGDQITYTVVTIDA